MNIKDLLNNLNYLVVIIISVISIGSIISVIAIFAPDLLVKSNTNGSQWNLKDLPQDLPQGRDGKLIKYGFLLISESPAWIGPMAQNESMRYAGNNLSCKNCHLQFGTQPGSGSWVGVINRFPQFRGREDKKGTIEDRINGCMERSMNGRKLPVDSRAMQAMVAYMDWLGDGIPKELESTYKGFPKIKIPEFKADLEMGEEVYNQQCTQCHQPDGKGVWLPDSTKGYLYPPLWGKDSYNHGAGMHRIITAAEFIKGNMPFGEVSFGKPKLSDEESFNVAAYINSFERPLKLNPEEDFPDKKLKPVSTSYGPWVDDFSADQHKYGPFPPIIEFYQNEYGIKKSK